MLSCTHTWLSSVLFGRNCWPVWEQRERVNKVWNRSISIASLSYLFSISRWNSLFATLMTEATATTSLPPTSAHTPTQALTHLQGLSCYFLWLRACSPLARSYCFYQFSFDCSSAFSSSVSPYLSPCNSTLSALVSRLLADGDCSRPGLDFPVLTSFLCALSFGIISTPTPHPVTLKCFSSPIPSFFLCDF